MANQNTNSSAHGMRKQRTRTLPSRKRKLRHQGIEQVDMVMGHTGIERPWLDSNDDCFGSSQCD